jgi:hypothetical protein
LKYKLGLFFLFKVKVFVPGGGIRCKSNIPPLIFCYF